VARELALAYRLSVEKLKGHMARSSVERLDNWILTEAHRDAAQGNIVIPLDRGTPALAHRHHRIYPAAWRR
jgi:CRP/FNR family transcriptional regulator, transcriptional activator FtrB